MLEPYKLKKGHMTWSKSVKGGETNGTVAIATCMVVSIKVNDYSELRRLRQWLERKDKELVRG